jgi:hypothetical protein
LFSNHIDRIFNQKGLRIQSHCVHPGVVDTEIFSLTPIFKYLNHLRRFVLKVKSLFFLETLLLQRYLLFSDPRKRIKNNRSRCDCSRNRGTRRKLLHQLQENQNSQSCLQRQRMRKVFQIHM